MNGEKIWEKHYPCLGALLVAGCTFFSSLDFTLKNFGLILSAIITIGTILIGFLATMMSILITITGRRVMKKIRDYGAADLLNHYFYVSLVSGFIITIFSTLLYALLDVQNPISHYMMVFWISSVSYFLLTAFRVVHIMSQILKSIMKEDENDVREVKVVANAENAWKKT